MPNNITINSSSSRRLIVTSQPKNRISINTSGGGGGGPSTSIDTLVELKDVDATSLDDNETIVYDAASGKFKVETLPIVDGGTF
jgi:hypothetical protein